MLSERAAPVPAGAVVRRFADAGGPLLVSNSFSKSFSLYGERVGALSVVAASADEAARLLMKLKRVVRTNYSNPPVHGGKVVATVLATPELRQLWEEEHETLYSVSTPKYLLAFHFPHL